MLSIGSIKHIAMDLEGKKKIFLNSTTKLIFFKTFLKFNFN